MRLALTVARIIIGCGLVAVAVFYRAPLLSEIRYFLLAGLVSAVLPLIAFEVWTISRTANILRAGAVLSLVIAIAAFAVTLVEEIRFQTLRREVLRTNGDDLALIGKHIVVGYRDPVALEELIERRAIAGVFLTRRNIVDRSAADIAAMVASWQSIRRRQGLPPLWIATDQEGGPVSRLSPPLPRQPALSTVVRNDAQQRDSAVRAYAKTQADALRSVGVNLNLAPVVDVNHGIVNPSDRYSQIFSRALSTDPLVVAKTAAVYCATLKASGVDCVLKHFPGLGRVANDTHVEDAALETPVSVMAASDWLPFRSSLEAGTRFIMMGHVRYTPLDAQRPASAAPAVIKVLRADWGFNGAVITDDVTMAAFFNSRAGLVGSAVEALNAGVDLLLIAYDAEQVYPAVAGLVAAYRQGALPRSVLETSAARLDALN